MPKGRRTTTPFPRGPGRIYWCRVPRVQAGLGSTQRSLGTSNEDLAKKMCEFLQNQRDLHAVFLLEQLADGKASVADAYQATLNNQLPKFVDDLRNPPSRSEPEPEVNVEPYIAKWQSHLKLKGKPAEITRLAYLRQIRTLIPGAEAASDGKPAKPAPPFLVSQFTEDRIEEWLEDLKNNHDVTAPNRFRAAALSFGNFLRKKKVIKYNPAAQVSGIRENPSRCRWLTQAQAKKVIGGMTGAVQAYHALAAATAMEGQALGVFTPSDIAAIDVEHPDEAEIQAHGKKRNHRDRVVVVYTRWRWAYDIFLAWFNSAPREDDERVFADLSDKEMRQALRDACKAAKISDYLPHDWRHTWAVQGIKDGLSINVVAGQLGHSNPVMTLKVYGKFLPRAEDFRGRGKN